MHAFADCSGARTCFMSPADTTLSFLPCPCMWRNMPVKCTVCKQHQQEFALSPAQWWHCNEREQMPWTCYECPSVPTRTCTFSALASRVLMETALTLVTIVLCMTDAAFCSCKASDTQTSKFQHFHLYFFSSIFLNCSGKKSSSSAFSLN